MQNNVSATIRRAAAGDIDAVAEVYLRSWLRGFPNNLDPDQLPPDEYGRLLNEYRDHWSGIIRGGTHCVWLADVACEPAGIIQRGHNSNGTAHLQSLYVLPRFRGLGIGDQLMDAALAGLPAGTRVTLEVAADARPAIELYRKEGFIEAGPLEPSPLVSYPAGEAVPAIIMEKKI